MRAEAMSAYTAPISHLLSSPNFNFKSLKIPPLLNPATTRRSLLFSLSSLTSLALAANAKLLHQPSFMDALASNFDPLTQAEKDASTLITRRVSEAVELLERGKELQALGDFPKALQFFTSTFNCPLKFLRDGLDWTSHPKRTPKSERREFYKHFV